MAISTSTPVRKACSWGPMPTPPKTAAADIEVCTASWRACSSIWAASSRVGVRIRARVTPRVLPERRLKIGSRKAAVLPLPVMAQASTSRPSMAGGIESDWIGVGRVNPISRTPRRRSGCSPNWEKGTESSSRMFLRLVCLRGNGGFAGEAYVLSAAEWAGHGTAQSLTFEDERQIRADDMLSRMRALWIGLALASVLAAGCGKSPAASISAATPASSPAPTAVAAAPAAPYAPGLGELMSFNQMRHSKLWFAGKARNWKLAAYELDELREGFEDVVRYYAAEHKDSPIPIGEAVQKIMTEPLTAVGRAIEKQDPVGFVGTYDALTDGCNRCHQATNFGFNVVQRPTSNPYSNQVFAPAPP